MRMHKILALLATLCASSSLGLEEKVDLYDILWWAREIPGMCPPEPFYIDRPTYDILLGAVREYEDVSDVPTQIWESACWYVYGRHQYNKRVIEFPGLLPDEGYGEEEEERVCVHQSTSYKSSFSSIPVDCDFHTQMLHMGRDMEVLYEDESFEEEEESTSARGKGCLHIPPLLPVCRPWVKSEAITSLARTWEEEEAEVGEDGEEGGTPGSCAPLCS